MSKRKNGSIPRNVTEQKEDNMEAVMEKKLMRGHKVLSAIFLVIRLAVCIIAGFSLALIFAVAVFPYLIGLTAAMTGVTYDSSTADLFLIMAPAVILFSLICFHIWKRVISWLYQSLARFSQKMTSMEP